MIFWESYDNDREFAFEFGFYDASPLPSKFNAIIQYIKIRK